MLLEDEKKYIKTIPQEKVAKIFPFTPKAVELADKIIRKIKKACPSLKVFHMGASALGISGQKDLDIYAPSTPGKFLKYLPKLIELFGQPQNQKKDSISWRFRQEGYEVEFYLTNPDSPTMKRQITVFNILRKNKDLLGEYERLKESMDGKSFREYQRKKYEFYHRILKLN